MSDHLNDLASGRKYRISLKGCDDTTTIEVIISPELVSILSILEKLFNKESEKGECKPTFYMQELL